MRPFTSGRRAAVVAAVTTGMTMALGAGCLQDILAAIGATFF